MVGKVLKQYTRACLLLGQQALDKNQPDLALRFFEQSLDIPRNLGEAYHMLQAKADVNYWNGKALRALGRESEAITCFTASAQEAGDFQQMAVTAHSELSYYRALSLFELNQKEAARRLLDELKTFAQNKMQTQAKIDYFATSLPNLLVFEEDLQSTQEAHAGLLLKLAEQGINLLGSVFK